MISDTEFAALEVREKLIHQVASYPELYDAQSSWYKDLARKNKLWALISDITALPESECRKGWKNLRDRYFRELKRSLADREYVPTWRYFAMLKFLKPHWKERRSISGEDPLGHFMKDETAAALHEGTSEAEDDNNLHNMVECTCSMSPTPEKDFHAHGSPASSDDPLRPNQEAFYYPLPAAPEMTFSGNLHNPAPSRGAAAAAAANPASSSSPQPLQPSLSSSSSSSSSRSASDASSRPTRAPPPAGPSATASASAARTSSAAPEESIMPQLDAFEQRLFSVLFESENKEDHDDPVSQFMLSLVPLVRELPKEKQMDVRIEFLNVIKKMGDSQPNGQN